MKPLEAREPRPLRRVQYSEFSPPQALEPTLADYVGIVWGARWLILAAALLAVIGGAIHVALATPRYQSDILIQIEEKAQGLGLEDLSDAFSGKVPAEAEVEIIRSRWLVGSVVEELSLDVSARPRTFPVIGEAIFRAHENVDLRNPVLGMTRFAWGGELISISGMTVPRDMLGKPFTLVAGVNGGYELRNDEARVILRGNVGTPAEANGFALTVTDLRARPGTEFRVMRARRERVVQALQRELSIGERGKKTGMLQVSLQGAEPIRTAEILDAIARTYVRQNVERKSAEAQKTLEFLETQLPQLKVSLEEAEAKLESYRSTKGTLNVSLETQAMLTRSVELEKALSELEMQRAELKHRFTENHPLLVTVGDKLEQFSRERAAIEQRFKKLPQAEMDSARLMRDARVANELYVLLLNKAQELRVLKSGTVGNVRVIDSAVEPLDPVYPRRARTIGLSFAFGLTLGIGLAFARRALSRGVEDPEVVESDFGLAVYASVPRSNAEVRLTREHRENHVLAVEEPQDVAVESFRSLRTSVQFALIDAPNRIICVLGPSPSIGKSFTSANLGVVLGESGKRVLVVDGDLRKGRLHKYFGGRRDNGLSELIIGTATTASVIRSSVAPNVDFIATGRTPPNTAGLLGSERFGAILQELASLYDFVVIDTAPVLAVTDGVLVARHCGVNLMVLRAGKHPVRELKAALRRFEQGGVRVHGAVLNDVNLSTSSYGGYHYQYEYGAKHT